MFKYSYYPHMENLWWICHQKREGGSVTSVRLCVWLYYICPLDNKLEGNASSTTLEKDKTVPPSSPEPQGSFHPLSRFLQSPRAPSQFPRALVAPVTPEISGPSWPKSKVPKLSGNLSEWIWTTIRTWPPSRLVWSSPRDPRLLCSWGRC